MNIRAQGQSEVQIQVRLRGQGLKAPRQDVGTRGDGEVSGLEPQTSALLHRVALGTPCGAVGGLGCQGPPL